MGDTTTTYGDISPRTAAYAIKQLLETGDYVLVSEKFGMPYVIPSKSSKVGKFRRYLDYPNDIGVLNEGVTPDGHKITYEDVLVTLEQIGDYVEITDVILDTHEDPVLMTASKKSGKQAGEVKEIRRISVLKAGTTVFYSNGTQRTDVASTISRGKLREIVRTLKRNKAEYFTEIIGASPKYATEPVGPSFWAMAHTDLDSDIQNLAGFTPVEKYSDSMKAQPGEIGKCENIRFITTPLFTPWTDAGGAVGATGLISTSAAQIDVYPIIIVAPDAYGIVPLKGRNAVTMKVVNPETPSKSDPLGQKGTVGWKGWDATVILNDNWMARLEVGATENPS